MQSNWQNYELLILNVAKINPRWIPSLVILKLFRCSVMWKPRIWLRSPQCALCGKCAVSHDLLFHSFNIAKDMTLSRSPLTSLMWAPKWVVVALTHMITGKHSYMHVTFILIGFHFVLELPIWTLHLRFIAKSLNMGVVWKSSPRQNKKKHTYSFSFFFFLFSALPLRLHIWYYSWYLAWISPWY